MNQSQVIKCPFCLKNVDITQAISHDLEEQLKLKETDLNNRFKKYSQELSDKLEKDKSQALLDQKRIITEDIKKQLIQDSQIELESLRKTLDEKADKLKEFQYLQVEHEKQKRIMEEMELKYKLDSEKKINEELKKIREIADKDASDKSELKVKEKDILIDQMRKQIEDMNRKMLQGSMQVQGEVQELLIEEFLTQKFPLDKIIEIKKGQGGGDCIQKVYNNSGFECGSIYYESKRTKAFQNSWIPKFKEDMRKEKSVIGLLITEVMPKELDSFGKIDGIYICTYQDFKSLCYIFRDTVLSLGNLQMTQINKGDKMSMVYGYFTSDEFKTQVEAVLEGFMNMKVTLDKEKNVMEKLWAEREKQIKKTITSLNYMQGSISGLTNDEIQLQII